jgi:ketosteroid isomerase-like protein
MTDTTNTSTDTRAVVERYVAAVEAGDGPAIRELFAAAATWRLFGDMPMSGTWRGRDTIIDEFLAGALGHYEPGSIRLEITAIVADGERAVVEWTSRARTRRGEPYENFCVGVFTVRDGKIQAVREYMDTAYATCMLFGGDRAAA